MVMKKLMKKLRNKEEVPAAPEAAKDEMPDTPIINTDVEQPKEDAIEEKDINYYQENYSTINFNAASSDRVICTLLFGVLTEVKKLREEIKRKK